MMLCPNCGSEYRDGFNLCVDCGSTLHVAPPEEEVARRTAEAERRSPDIVLVSVFNSQDATLVTMAKALLESAHLDYVARGKGVLDFAGWRGISSPFDMVTGPTSLFVRKDDEAEANSLLANLKSEPVPGEVSIDDCVDSSGEGGEGGDGGSAGDGGSGGGGGNDRGNGGAHGDA